MRVNQANAVARSTLPMVGVGVGFPGRVACCRHCRAEVWATARCELQVRMDGAACAVTVHRCTGSMRDKEVLS